MCSGLCVISGPDQVHRHVGPVTNDPAVVSARDVEDVAGAELEHPAVVHRRRGTPADHDPDVLDLAARLLQRAANVLGPFPTWLVRSACDCQAADPYEFELSLVEGSNFIRTLESFEHDVEHAKPPSLFHKDAASSLKVSCRILPRARFDKTTRSVPG